MQKVIIERSMNMTPEAQLEETLAPLLAEGFRVVAATTALALQGEMDTHPPMGLFYGVAKHVYFVTTVILERE